MGETSELVPNEFLHKPGDFRKLAEDIAKLASDRNLAMETAKRNFEKAKEYYSNVVDGRREEFIERFYNG